MIAKGIVVSVLCLVLYLSIPCFAEEADIEDCGSETGSIVKIEMEGCENESRCPLKKGTNITLHASFKSKVTSKTLNAVVYGKLPFFKRKFPLPNPNACETGVICPLVPDVTNVYTVSIFIKPNYPKVTVDIEFRLKDDNGKSVICAIIPAQIVAN